MSRSPSSESRPDLAALAGHTDELVLEKTGRSWREWVHELDGHGAHGLEHRDIAALVAGYGVPMWWTQAVSVGYERIKGLRVRGQRRDGSFEASRSKTIAASVDELFERTTNTRRRARWWPGVEIAARPDAATPTVRARQRDGSVTQLWFAAKGPDRTTVTVTGSNLADAAAADAFKKEWGERLARLAELV